MWKKIASRCRQATVLISESFIQSILSKRMIHSGRKKMSFYEWISESLTHMICSKTQIFMKQRCMLQQRHTSWICLEPFSLAKRSKKDNIVSTIKLLNIYILFIELLPWHKEKSAIDHANQTIHIKYNISNKLTNKFKMRLKINK